MWIAEEIGKSIIRLNTLPFSRQHLYTLMYVGYFARPTTYFLFLYCWEAAVWGISFQTQRKTIFLLLLLSSFSLPYFRSSLVAWSCFTPASWAFFVSHRTSIRDSPETCPNAFLLNVTSNSYWPPLPPCHKMCDVICEHIDIALVCLCVLVFMLNLYLDVALVKCEGSEAQW